MKKGFFVIMMAVVVTLFGLLDIARGQGLVSWWPGDGNANDIIDGNNGTLQGDVTFTTGKISQGFHFNGGFIEVADAANLQITGPMTLEAWVSFSGATTPSPPPIAAKWGPFHLGMGGYGIFIFTDGKPAFIVSSIGWDRIDCISPEPLPQNTFAHVAGVWTGTQLEIYVNGVLKASTSFAGPIFGNNGIPCP